MQPRCQSGSGPLKSHNPNENRPFVASGYHNLFFCFSDFGKTYVFRPKRLWKFFNQQGILSPAKFGRAWILAPARKGWQYTRRERQAMIDHGCTLRLGDDEEEWACGEVRSVTNSLKGEFASNIIPADGLNRY
jgi:hypothetical protein